MCVCCTKTVISLIGGIMLGLLLVLLTTGFCKASENNTKPTVFKMPTQPIRKNKQPLHAKSIKSKMHEFSHKPMPRLEKFITLSDDQLKTAFDKEFLPACLNPQSPFSTKTHDQLQQLFLQLVAQERKKIVINNHNQ